MAVLDEVPQHPRPPRPKKPKATATKTKADGDDNAFKVAVRCRPLLPREKTAQPDSALTISGTSVAVTTNPDDEAMAGGRTPRAASPRRPRRGSQEETVKAYSFDRVYDASSTQEGLYSELVGPYAAKMHSGYNVTVFAYGQTGTGKTYTVLGEAGEGRGIVPRFVEDVMARATAERGAAAAAAPLADGAALDDAAAEAAPKLLVESTLERVCLGVYEVYEGKVFDLLRPDDGGGGGALAADGQGPLGTQVTLEMEKPRAGIEGRSYWVKGCAGEREIASADEAMGLVRGAARLRHTSAHKLNETSSRSHCIVSLSLRRRREVFKLGRGADGAWRYAPQPQKSAELVTRANLVDLAGSEDQRDTQSSGSTLREAADINRSLFTLRKAIEHLALKKHTRAVFQEETLTKLLASSLLGQAYALMIATISPLAAAARHTRNTLHYAGTASAIQLSAPKPAEDDFQLRNLELQKRNRALLKQLEQKGQAFSDLEARMQELLAEREEAPSPGRGGGGGDADGDGELAGRCEELEQLNLQLTQLLTSSGAAPQPAAGAGDDGGVGTLAEARSRERFDRRALLETARGAELPSAGAVGGGERLARLEQAR